ncbi:MAG: hypothetical protein RXO36_05130 [Candidatus Nanopusillus acidilobi]
MMVSLIVDTILYFATTGVVIYIAHLYDAKYLEKPILVLYNLLGLFLFSPLKFALLSFSTVVLTFLLGALT